MRYASTSSPSPPGRTGPAGGAPAGCSPPRSDGGSGLPRRTGTLADRSSPWHPDPSGRTGDTTATITEVPLMSRAIASALLLAGLVLGYAPLATDGHDLRGPKLAAGTVLLIKETGRLTDGVMELDLGGGN